MGFGSPVTVQRCRAAVGQLLRETTSALAYRADDMRTVAGWLPLQDDRGRYDDVVIPRGCALGMPATHAGDLSALVGVLSQDESYVDALNRSTPPQQTRLPSCGSESSIPAFT